MKKILSVLLILSMLLALGLTLASCGDGNTNNGENESGENENGENNAPENESKYQITKDQWIKNLTLTNYTAESTSPEDAENTVYIYADNDVLKQVLVEETNYIVMIDGDAYMIYNELKFKVGDSISLVDMIFNGVSADEDYDNLVYDSENNSYSLSVTDAGIYNGEFTFYFEDGIIVKTTILRTLEETTHTINTSYYNIGTTVVDYEYTPEK